MNLGDTFVVYEDVYGVFWEGDPTAHPMSLDYFRQVALENVAGEIGDDQTIMGEDHATYISRAINQRLYKNQYGETFMVHSIELIALPIETPKVSS